MRNAKGAVSALSHTTEKSLRSCSDRSDLRKESRMILNNKY